MISPETLMLTHYRNLLTIVKKQLVAIEQENVDGIDKQIAQKQVIIDQIQSLQTQFSYQDLSKSVNEELKQLLTDINELEQQSMNKLFSCQDSVRQKLVLANKVKNLQDAYEAPLAAGTIINQHK